ncbi:MAG: hypothetical protein K2L49_00610 [Muribaculaceae bacterium]|nr:hypothetical protein [Muribaculaceae bacterium]
MKYEIVGSFLPPMQLLTARQAFMAGQLGRDSYQRVEDESVDEIIDRQLEVGLEVVSSGEIRRKVWDKDFYFGLHGISVEHVDSGRVYQDLEVFEDQMRLTERIAYNPDHPFFEDYIYLSQYVGGRAACLQSIPSPADLYIELLVATDGKFAGIYDTADDLINDIADAYNRTIMHFYDLGCRHIQLDDTVCGRLCDRSFYKRLVLGGFDPVGLYGDIVGVINRSVRELPSDMEVSLYLSGGEKVVPRWVENRAMTSPIRDILPELSVDKFFMPFVVEDEDALGILSALPRNRKVVLGLLSAHSPFHEEASSIATTVDLASEHIPRHNLSISPACGFKMTNFLAHGLVYDDQWRKIRQLSEIAAAI